MTFAHPHFAAPAWLWLAVLAPAGFGALCLFAARARARQLDAIAEPGSQSRLLRSHSPLRRILKNALIALVLAGIGFALARPQWGLHRTAAANLQGEDLMIVLDCSRSMLTADVRPNRLDRARFAIMDFVQAHPGGRVGLTAFAGQAFVQCPLTFDYDAFGECLMAVDARAIPVQGTDLARALEEASKAMEKGDRRKLMVLVTDGEDLEHEGVQKARELAEAGVVVYTIGVGTGEGRSIQVLGETGQLELLRDNKGQVVTSRLDENTLRAIAAVTEGEYHPLGSVGQGLVRVREAIEFSSGKSTRNRIQGEGIDRFHWFLAATLALMSVESLIGTRRRMSENARA